jgi:hypothetical protein
MNFLCQQQKFSRRYISFSELNGLEASFDRTIDQRDKRTALSVVTIGDKQKAEVNGGHVERA